MTKNIKNGRNKKKIKKKVKKCRLNHILIIYLC